VPLGSLFPPETLGSSTKGVQQADLSVLMWGGPGQHWEGALGPSGPRQGEGEPGRQSGPAKPQRVSEPPVGAGCLPETKSH
jgi:hypothetical protein